MLRHQLRLLVGNRSACIVLATIVATAIAAPRVDSPPEEVCYIVYWQDHPWVERLRASLANDDASPNIQIKPVEQFTDEAGVIAYPDRCHSIQLRPPSGRQDHWLVWFWHGGSRVDALNPYVDWFWAATGSADFVQRPVHVRVSSLRPGLGVLNAIGPEARFWIATGHWRAPLVWTTIFFCGCYLTAMALAQQREDGTLASIAATPVGWSGIGRSTGGFHFSLTVLLGLLVAVALGFPPDALLCLTIALSALIYVGVGVTLGCWCRGPASTSASMMVYLSLSIGWLLLLRSIDGSMRWGNCAELQIVEALERHPGAGYWGLSLWGMFWIVLARLSFTHLKAHPR